jgi:bleomycin hydrolase
MEQKYLKYKSKYLDLKARQTSDDSVGRMTGGALPFQLSLVNNSLGSLAKDNSIINKNPYIFNHEIKSKLPITEQKASGRCWLFATLNLIRSLAYQNWESELKIKIDNLEFSQSYIFFFDKFERYRRNLYYFIKINKMANNSQYLVKIYYDPLSDGGQWDMAKEIIKKYGIVPKDAMPDSFHAKSTGGMNKLLTENLKQDFMTLSKSDESTHEKLIESMMKRVRELLVGFLGEPPTEFNFTFKDKHSDKVISWTKLTPLKLLEKTQFKPDEWVSIVNDPRKEHPFNKYYQVEFLGNVMNQHVGWINLEINRLKQLAKESLDSNEPVWFGCDVGAHHDGATGIHHPNIIDLKTFMNYENNLTKEEKLKTYTALPNHAMVVVGYHTEEGSDKNEKIVRWKIENSWGKKAPTNGFLLMTDEWFDQYVFQIVVHKSKLTEAEKGLLTTPPLIIHPWDSLGTLA